jgi:molybdopterin/thiamine biosynthesis adenylyltransferase
VDDDVVDLSNLQRQVIHGESTLGKLLSPLRVCSFSSMAC